MSLKSVWSGVVAAARKVYGVIVKSKPAADLLNEIVQTEVKAAADGFANSTGQGPAVFMDAAKAVYAAAVTHSFDWAKIFVQLGATETVHWLMSGPTRDLKRYYVIAKVTEQVAEKIAAGLLPPLATGLLNLAIETAFNELFPPDDAAALPA